MIVSGAASLECGATDCNVASSAGRPAPFPIVQMKRPPNIPVAMEPCFRVGGACLFPASTESLVLSPDLSGWRNCRNSSRFASPGVISPAVSAVLGAELQ